MINTLKAVVPIATVVLIAVLSLLIAALNVKKVNRYKQLRFPFIAVIYSTACCVLFAYLGKIVDIVINLSFMQRLLEWLSPTGKLDYIVILYAAILLNALALAAFIVIKGIARIRISKKMMPKKFGEEGGLKKLYRSFVNIFYDISSGKGNVRRGWVKAAKTFRYASVILSAAYILLMVFLQFPVFMSYSWIPYDFMKDCVKIAYLWPAISFIVVNEIGWFLDGKEEFSKPDKMAFDHIGMNRISDYGELAEQYKLQFPERFTAHIIAKAKGRVKNFHNDVKTDTELEKAIKNALTGRGYTVSENLLSCIMHLSEGENALIDASVFSDFGEYLFIYLNVLLSRGNNVMFLCSDDESAELIGKYIGDKFKEINNFHRIWLIKDSTNARGTTDADILVLTPQCILDENIFIGQTKFIDRFSTVVIVNSSEAIAKGGSLLTLLAHKLTQTVQTKSPDRKLQYIFLSESVPPETLNVLKQMLNLNDDIFLCDGYQAFDNTHLMLWNYESAKKALPDDPAVIESGKATLAQDNLFGGNDVQTYWGVALPIACVGIKYGVNRINIMSRKTGPNVQIINNMKNRMSRIAAYFNFDSGYVDFDETVTLNKIDNGDTHASFIIIEDELFNLPLVIYNYCRFGGSDTTMIHIISKPYMFRDYFAANAEKYIDNEAQLNMIAPSLSDTKQVIMTKILCEADENGIEEDELLSRIQSIDPTVTNIDDALEYCRDFAFFDGTESPIEYYFAFRSKSVWDAENVCFTKRRYIHLRKSTPLSKLVKESKQAKLEIRGEYYNLDIFSDRIYQHYLPSQCLVYKGSLYKITEIEAGNGIVHATEAPDRLDSPVDYIQVRTYELKSEPRLIELIPVPFEKNESRISEGYEIYRCKASITVDTSGYYALDPVSPTLDLAGGLQPRNISDAERETFKREYSDADVMLIKIKNVSVENTDRVSFLLSVMMNELMKTLFPYSYKCIAVCPVFSDGETVCKDELATKIKLVYPHVNVNMHIKHSASDVDILFIEDSVSDTGVFNTLLRDEQYPFKMPFGAILSYLDWFNTYEKNGNITKDYLFFGGDTASECFDFNTLMQILDDFERVIRTKPRKVDRITSKGKCSYCHKDLFNVEYTEIKDNAGKHNRKLCADCAKLIVTDENELKKLYRKTRKYLCGRFGIELSDNINVRFASAEMIRKRLKTGDKRAVVGFADPETRELWVETDAPATNILDVLSHELTHIWQFDNIKMDDREYIEGHASYVEVQYMRNENRTAFADWQEASLEQRDDEYGRGFRMLRGDLNKRGDYNSFSYMLELFGEDGTGRPPHDIGNDRGDVNDSDDGKGIAGIDGSVAGEINKTPDSVPK